MLEKDIVNLILEYLKYRGHFCWRNNTGFFKRGYVMKSGEHKTSVFRAGIPGSSDIIGVAKNGKMIAIEVKVPGGKTTELQDSFINEVVERKGIAFVAYGLDEVTKAGL